MDKIQDYHITTLLYLVAALIFFLSLFAFLNLDAQRIRAYEIECVKNWWEMVRSLLPWERIATKMCTKK